jgi:hypothetical protein
MESLFVFILVMLPFAWWLYSQKIDRDLLDDEEDDSPTKQVDEETGETLDLVPHPYSPWSNRVVFLQRGQKAWWDNLSPKEKSKIWGRIQAQLKSGKIEKVYNEEGKLIGLKNVNPE